MGLVWAFLPGGFGLNNFKDTHGPMMGSIGTLTWILLLLAHPFALYKIWTGGGGDVYWWLLLPLALHILFFVIFGRAVSTG